MINIPVLIYTYILGIQINYITFINLFVFNLVIHIITDNAKANLLKINLIQDQLIHIMQIVFTWVIYISVF